MTKIPDDPVVVIGGGIPGLAAAYQLQRDGMPVRLFEAADEVGGKIRTTEFEGRMVDEAADAFLARVPHGIELAICLEPAHVCLPLGLSVPCEY